MGRAGDAQRVGTKSEWEPGTRLSKRFVRPFPFASNEVLMVGHRQGARGQHPELGMAMPGGYGA